MAIVDSTFVHAELKDGYCLARVLCEKVTEREASILTGELTQAADQAGGRIAIDVSEIAFLASAGIGTFVSINKLAMERGGKMALFGLQPELLDVLKVTRLHKLFALARTEDGAIKAVS